MHSGRDGDGSQKLTSRERIIGNHTQTLRQYYLGKSSTQKRIERDIISRRNSIGLVVHTIGRETDKIPDIIFDHNQRPSILGSELAIETLEQGKPARSVECDDEEKALLSEVALLTNKPVIYAANLSDADFSDGIEQNAEVQKIAAEEHAGVLPICAQIEEEIVEMDAEEKEMFLTDLGLEESGLDRLIKECYSLLGLISYLTAGKQEVRAWTIKKGTKAPQAAGKIHSDFERGFIRAEVIAFDDLVACGSMTAAKEKGLVRSEGKEYVMKDGDVVLFRFNV